MSVSSHVRSWLKGLARQSTNNTPIKKYRAGIEELEVRQVPSGAKLDLGTLLSAATSGYTSFPVNAYSPDHGHGWLDTTGIRAVDRGIGTPLTRDFHEFTSGTLLFDVPNGRYNVTASLGDALAARDNVAIWAEGQLMARGLTTRAGQFLSTTFQVDVTDGQLTLRFVDEGGVTNLLALGAVEVQPAPVSNNGVFANAGAYQTSTEGSKVTFSGQASGGSTYAWDFGDGTTAAGTLSPTKVYADSGSYRVTLTVTDAAGRQARDTTVVFIENVAPTATFRSAGVAAEGTPITLSFTKQYDPSSTDTTAGFRYSYDFDNDGTWDVLDSTSDSVSHVFDDNGTRLVRGRIKDKDGGFKDYSLALLVTNVSPRATFTNDGPASAGQAVTFTFTNQSDPSAADVAAGFKYSYDFNNDGKWDVVDVPAASHGFYFSSAGTYVVKGRIKDKDNGYTDYSTTVNVRASAAPTATFGNDGPVNEGGVATLRFTNQTDPAGQGLRYSYDFNNDGAWDVLDAVDAARSFTFNDNGTYVVKGRVKDAAGAFTDYQTSVVVNNVAPQATFTNSGPATAGQPVGFAFADVRDPSAADVAAGFRYSYDFNNDGTWDVVDATTATRSFTFTTAGTYVVKGRVKDKDGGFTDYSTSVAVNPGAAPTATFGNNGPANEGSQVNFTFTNQVDGSGTPLRYSYDFNNDGTWDVVDAADAARSFTFNDNGTYVVRGRIKNGAGQFTDYTTTVVVNNVAPQATFTNSGPATAGQPVNFAFTNATDPSSADTTAGFRYSYDFDNDGTWDVVDATTATRSFTFTTAGTYVVKGRVKDKDGGFTDYSTSVTVNPGAAPTATFGNNGPANEGSQVNFTFTNQVDGSGTPLRYSYDFNNDGTWDVVDAADAARSFTFNDNGTYVVRGRIKNGAGQFTDYSTSVVVNNVAPTAQFSNGGAVNEGSPATFSFANATDPSSVDVSAGFRYSYDFDNDGAWDVVDATSPTATRAFADNGTYVVRGRIKDKDGGFTDYSTSVAVNNVAPQATFGSSGAAVAGQPVAFAFTNATDPSSADAAAGFRYSYDFNNDGVWDATDVAAATQTFTFAAPGDYVVRGRIKDKDGGFTSYVTTVTVQPAAGTPGAASFVRVDATTSGNWRSVYGTQGYVLAGNGVSLPAGLQVAVNGTTTYTWAASTSDSRGLLKAGSTQDRIAAAWIANSFTVDVSVPTGETRAVAMYFLDWNAISYVQDVAITDARTGNVLDSRTIGDFRDGKYLVWNVQGDVRFQFTASPNNFFPNALLSGIFIGLEGSAAPTATFANSGPGSPGNPITFSFTNQFDPSGTGLRYSYDFNNDGVWDVANSTNSTATYSFAANGSYVVRGRIQSVSGPYTDYVTNVTIGDAIPTATFGVSGAANEGSPTTFAFTNQSDPSGSGLRYSYDFNNDGTWDVLDSASATANHAFADNGTQVVRGRIKDLRGAFTDYLATVVVSNVAPQANFTNNGPVDPGSAVTISFTNATDPSSADVAAGFRYSYDFNNDGAWDVTDVTANVQTYVFPSVGAYVVRGRIKDKDGGFRDYTTSVTVGTPTFITTPYDRIPNFGANPTIVSIASGNWSSPSTWSAGRLPREGDVVAINANFTVTYDVVSDLALNTIVINPSGKLVFRTDVNTRVVVQNFLVLEGGELRVGTAANPVAANVKAEILFADLPLNLAADPEQYGNGLIALGKVQMHGAVKSDTFMRLAVEPRVGDTTITLQQPVTGWRAGDRLILPDSRQLRYAERGPGYVPQWEFVYVASVSADGRVITLTAPLQFNHPGVRDGDGVLRYLPHVGNTTRSVVVRSQNMRGNRGHVMFTRRADVDVRFVSFGGLGRTTNDPFNNATFNADGTLNQVGTNQAGRYPIHFNHLIGPATTPANGYQYTFVGNTVICPLDPMPFRWGINVNDSHYGLIKDNVLFNWAGAGIMLETGAESYNVIDHNFIVRTTGTGWRADSGGRGTQGDGIWLSGPNNYVRNNVVAMVNKGTDQTFGYTLYFLDQFSPRRAPSAPGADPLLNGQYAVFDSVKTALREFAGNEVYGSSSSGLEYWGLNATSAGAEDGQGSTIRDLQVWNVSERGIFAYFSSQLTFDGLKVFGDYAAVAANEWTAGFDGLDYFTKDLLIINSHLEGLRHGFLASTASDGTQTIKNSYVRTLYGVSAGTLWTSGSQPFGLRARTIVVDNVRFGTSAQLPGSVAISMGFNADPVRNLIQRDQLFVYNFNQVPGDNFQVYYREQAPNFIVPQTITVSSTTTLLGSPEAGLTNQQNWDRYGIAIAGAVAYNTTERAGINGLVRAL